MAEAQRTERVAVARRVLAAGRLCRLMGAADRVMAAARVANELGISRGRAFAQMRCGLQLLERLPKLAAVFAAGAFLPGGTSAARADERVVLTVKFFIDAVDDPQRVRLSSPNDCAIPWFLSAEGFSVEPAQDFAKTLKGDARLPVNGVESVPFEAIMVNRGGKKYAVYFDRVELRDVAKETRHMPDEFINKAGNDVTQAFIKYAAPIVGPLPKVGRLKTIPIAKK